ncbi:MAG: DUF2079 domain-containing protein [Proteobacteria bacterium]|nr:MAG: DUF2079 domain-containing protein [Pseudomonadota bacterium]
MPIRSIHLVGLILSPLLLATLLGGVWLTHPLMLSLRNASYLSLIVFLFSLLVPSFRKSFRRALSSREVFEDLERNERKLVIALFTFFLIVYLKATALDYFTFKTNAIDTSMYDYALKNTLEGKFFYPVDGNYSHFGVHFTPTLLLLLPFVWIFHSPLFTLFLHPVVIAISGLILYQQILKSAVPLALARLGILFSYFNCIWLGLILHFHFHAEVLYLPLTFLLVGAVRDRKGLLIILYSALYLGVKEDAPFYLAGFYMAFSFKKWMGVRAAATGIMLSMVYAVLVLKLGIPAFKTGEYQLVPAVSEYGTSLSSIIQGVLRSLPEFLGGLTRGGWIKAASQWLFLPGLDSFFVIAALPFVMIHNFAFGGSMRALHMHYSSPFIPLVYVGLANSFQLLWNRFPKRRSRVLSVFTLGFLCSNLMGGGYLVFRRYESGWKVLSHINQQIPRDETVCIQPDALNHLNYHEASVEMYSDSCVSRSVKNLILQTELSSFNTQPEETRKRLAFITESGRYELKLNELGWYWYRLK